MENLQEVWDVLRQSRQSVRAIDEGKQILWGWKESRESTALISHSVWTPEALDLIENFQICVLEELRDQHQPTLPFLGSSPKMELV